MTWKSSGAQGTITKPWLASENQGNGKVSNSAEPIAQREAPDTGSFILSLNLLLHDTLCAFKKHASRLTAAYSHLYDPLIP